MVEMAGEAHVGLGSDFDGAPMPEGLGSAAELQVLVAGMEVAGFGADLIDRICHRNWRDFLARTLPRD
jgi:membrane dipeptidase